MITSQVITTHHYFQSPLLKHQIAVNLEKGGLLLYPTETTYGLGCNAFLTESIRRINKIKNRPEEKPQIMLINFSNIQKWIANYKIYSKLIEKLWPGPITMILRSNQKIPEILQNQSGATAFRVSPSTFIKDLLSNLDFPITSTSANISGEPLPDNRAKLIQMFKDKVDYIITGEEQAPNQYSTIIDVLDFPRKIRVLREGAYPLAKLKEYFPNVHWETI